MFKYRYTLILSMLCALVVVVMNAPAAWLIPIVRHMSRGYIDVQQAWGTVWAGQAQWVLVRSPQERMVLPDIISWQLDVRQLVQGKLSAQLFIQGKTVALQVDAWPNPTRVQLQSGAYFLPAQTLSRLGAPFNTLKLTGVLTLQWGGINQLLASPFTLPPLTVYAQTLRTPIVNSDLGSYQINLNPSASGTYVISLQTPNTQDPLQLSGRGTVKANGAVQFELQARGQDTANADRLQAILNLLGRKQGDMHVLKIGL